MALFADDTVMISDGGGKVRSVLKPVNGASAIARFVIGVLKKNESFSPIHTLTEINRPTAFITSISGKSISATVLDIRDGLIHKLFLVINPESLEVLLKMHTSLPNVSCPTCHISRNTLARLFGLN